jgi:tetratricopeptide (TPR) repeat protein
VPILDVLEVLRGDHPFHNLDPVQRRRLIVRAISRNLLIESKLQPVIVIFEDLRRSDFLTLELLNDLVECLPSQRVLLVVSYRSQHGDPWGGRSYYRQLHLDPLPSESMEELLNAHLGTDSNLAGVKDLLIERAEGNPFFLEEIARMLVETGILQRQRLGYSLAKPISSIQVPPKVQAVLASRIDRLLPNEKRLLQEAAVIGKDVPSALLRMISDVSEDEFWEYLNSLRAGEFLYETGLFPEPEYTFKHALTHEVAYASLLHERRRETHARILEAMETHYADRLGEHVERLAHHARLGEIWPKALTYLRQAGAKSVNRQANRAAVAFFESALAVLKHLPEDRSTLEQGVDIRFDIRNALQPLGDLSHILEYLHEAERLAAQLVDERRQGWVASYLCEHYRMIGAPELAAKAGERALHVAQSMSDLSLRAVTNLPMGLLFHALGQYARAIAMFKSNIEMLDGELLEEQFGLFGLLSVFSRGFLAWCHAELGEFAQGEGASDEGLRIASAVEHPFSLVYAQLGIGNVHLRKGNIEQAIEVLESAIALGRAADIPVGVAYGTSYLGYALARGGRILDGIAMLERSSEHAVSMNFIARHSLRLAYLGEAYLLGGRTDDAASTAAKALQLARKHQERGHEAYAFRLLAEVAASRDEHGEAEAHYRSGIELARQLGMRPLAAECYSGLARLSHRKGEPRVAIRHAKVARTLFGEMNMTAFLEHLEADVGSGI